MTHLYHITLYPDPMLNVVNRQMEHVGTFQLTESQLGGIIAMIITLYPEGINNGIYLLRIVQGNAQRFVGKMILR